MVWSQMEWPGSCCDSFSLKIFECLWYSDGIEGVDVEASLIVTFPMKYCSVFMALGRFVVRSPNIAFRALGAQRMMGS